MGIESIAGQSFLQNLELVGKFAEEGLIDEAVDSLGRAVDNALQDGDLDSKESDEISASFVNLAKLTTPDGLQFERLYQICERLFSAPDPFSPNERGYAQLLIGAKGLAIMAAETASSNSLLSMTSGGRYVYFPDTPRSTNDLIRAGFDSGHSFQNLKSAAVKLAVAQERLATLAGGQETLVGALAEMAAKRMLLGAIAGEP